MSTTDKIEKLKALSQEHKQTLRSIRRLTARNKETVAKRIAILIELALDVAQFKIGDAVYEPYLKDAAPKVFISQVRGSLRRDDSIRVHYRCVRSKQNGTPSKVKYNRGHSIYEDELKLWSDK